MISTPCKNCCFAVYDKNTQTGCSAGMLDKFRRANVEIQECYDEEKEFYVIQDRWCPAQRTDNWLKRYRKKNIHKVLANELLLKTDCIIYAYNSTTENIITTLDSLCNQEIKPSNIVIILNHSKDNERNLKPSHIIQALEPDKSVQEALFNYKGIPYNITYMANPVNVANLEKSLDQASIHFKWTWLMVFIAGKTVDTNFIKAFDYALHEKMMRFIMVEGDEEHHGLAMQHFVFKAIGGSSPVKHINNIISVIDKIKFITEDEGEPHLIKTFGDIC